MTSPYLNTQSTGVAGYSEASTGSNSSASSSDKTSDPLLNKYFGGYSGGGQSAQSVDPYNLGGGGYAYGSGGSYGGGYPYNPGGTYGGGYPPYYGPQTQPLNDTTALARIQSLSGQLDGQVSGQADGLIDVNDLRSALDDKSGKYSQTDKDALKYVIDNQSGLRGRLDHFDGKDDGVFSVNTLNKMMANPTSQPVLPLDQSLTNTKALQALQTYMKDHDWGRLDRSGLSHIADYGDNEEQKAAAKKLLKSDELFKAADTGRDNNGDYDGKISRDDLQSLINRAGVDKIGASSTPAIPVPPMGAQSTPMYSGNYYADSYYNNMYAGTLGPASQLFQNAPGAPGAPPSKPW